MSDIDRLFNEAQRIATERNLDLISAIELIRTQDMEFIKQEINHISSKIDGLSNQIEYMK